MKPRPLCTKLNEFLADGLGTGTFLSIQTHVLEGNYDRQSLHSVEAPGMLPSGGVSPVDFLNLLDDGKYSAVMADGAIISIQCLFEQERLTGHRYLFVPCPFDATLVELRPEEVPLSDWLRVSVLSEGPSVFRSVGTYRFDCVRGLPEELAEPHPVSHLTFGAASCRLPVRGPMSIADFLNFIFDNFHRNHRRKWLDYASFLTSEGTEPTITLDEQQLHHLNWLEEV